MAVPSRTDLVTLSAKHLEALCQLVLNKMNEDLVAKHRRLVDAEKRKAEKPSILDRVLRRPPSPISHEEAVRRAVDGYRGRFVTVRHLVENQAARECAVRLLSTCSMYDGDVQITQADLDLLHKRAVG